MLKNVKGKCHKDIHKQNSVQCSMLLQQGLA